MVNDRHYCLVDSPSSDRIIIVGRPGAGNSVEERAVV